jgi:hypothetical protein
MQQSFDQVVNWLDSQVGKTVVLTKKELSIGKNEVSDLDQVQLQLEKVSMRQLERKDPDNYLAEQTLMLHGNGSIQGGTKAERIPQGVYEIPLYGSIAAQQADDGMQIATERAIYNIRFQ